MADEHSEQSSEIRHLWRELQRLDADRRTDREETRRRLDGHDDTFAEASSEWTQAFKEWQQLAESRFVSNARYQLIERVVVAVLVALLSLGLSAIGAAAWLISHGGRTSP